MFAVIILGIGLSLSAGTFYFGLGQNAATTDESTAAAVARSAFETLGRVMTIQNTPVTGQGYSSLDLSPELIAAVRGTAISDSDPRFAWVAVYRRQPGSDVATVNVTVVKNPTGNPYTFGDLASYDPADRFPPVLMPKSVAVQLIYRDADGPDRVRINSPGGLLTPAVRPGAFLTLTSTGADGQTAGRVYRVGNASTLLPDTFNLVPGYDLHDPSQAVTATAATAGRRYADTQNPAMGFDGAAQDVALYTGLVQLR